MLTLALATFFTMPTAAAQNVLLVHSDGDFAGAATAGLIATGALTSLDVWDARASLPGVPLLSTYDAVLVYGNSNFVDSVGLGNQLASYVDAGGGVVFAHTTWDTSSVHIRGAAQHRIPLEYAWPRNIPGTLVIDDPASPIVAGVSSLTTNLMSAGSVARPGAHVVASTDTGNTIATEWASGAGTIVALDLFPVPSSVFSLSWTGDGYRMITNALQFAAANLGTPPSSTPIALASGTCGAPGVTLTVTGMTPGGQVGFLSGYRGDLLTIPGGPCAGLDLPMAAATFRGYRTADPSGSVTRTLDPAVAPCGQGYLAVDMNTCQRTGVRMFP